MYEDYNDLMERLFNVDPNEFSIIQDALSDYENADSDELDEIYESLSGLGKQAWKAFFRDYADGAVGGPWEYD